MKNLSFLLITFLSVTNVWSQTGFQLSPSPKSETTSSYNYAPQAVGDLVLTWLTSETMATAYGLQGAGRIAAYMELAPEDITEYSNAIGGRPLNIKQVQFYIRTDQLSVVTAAHVSIRKGTSLVASTEVVNQSVNLTGGWNYIDLNQEYALDATQSVYIGYQVTSSKEGYPIGVASGNVAKQGWLYVNENQSENVASGGYSCMIKAVATAPANAFIIHSLNIPDHTLLGEKLSVEGILENIGTTNITSFSLLYQTNGVNSAVHNFTGLDIAPYDLYTFKHPDSLAIDETKTYSISVTASDANGDGTVSTVKSVSTQGLANAVPRVSLHESFTSSTCGPCNPGNANLEAVLKTVDENQWVNIRYQMSWPSTGDPYYTEEGGVRRFLYEVNAVPFLAVDGKWGGDPRNYTKQLFNELTVIPSITALSAMAKTVEKTVSASITITPATTMNTQNLYLFAAVIEKTTTKNKKTNGETLFHNVMKKFLTSENGDPIENFATNVPQTVDLSYTFKGNYRLPVDANANRLINHSIEHSIEDFNNLAIVYWIQNMQNGVVLQAGRVDAKAPTGLSNITQSMTDAYIYDGSLHIRSGASVQGIDMYNVSGQKVLSTSVVVNNSVPVKQLPQGIYVVKIKTMQGDKVVKVIK